MGRGVWAAAAVSVAVTVIAGCAGWRPRPTTADVTPERELRQTDAVQAFEQRRDAVQLEAAMDRLRQNDLAGAEAMLTAIVKRRPDYIDARLRLGELLWSRGEAASAEPHLRFVVEREPGRADAHHALGLLLDGTDRREEARQHLARAAELEPENEAYRLALEPIP